MVTQAAEIMRPARGTVHVDHDVSEALTRFDQFGCDYLIALDGDEVVGVAERRSIEALLQTSPDMRGEFVGNVLMPETRTVRDSDALERLEGLFQEKKARLLVVVNAASEALGLVAPADVAAARNGEEADVRPDGAEPSPEELEARPSLGRQAGRSLTRRYGTRPNVKSKTER